MSLATNVDRAMKGRCIICNRRLPKMRIALYLAEAGQGWHEPTVEVCVCGVRCLRRYNDGETAA